MKIAYVTTYDSTDIQAWSGLGSYIMQALEKQGAQVIPVSSFPQYSDLRILLKRLYYRISSPGSYRSDRDVAVLKALGKAVSARLKELDVDVIFSPGTQPLSYLETDKPVVFWTDATFAGLVDTYLFGLSSETINGGNAAEQSALSNCAAAIYASEWARQTALKNYDVSAAKVHVVPFGANIACSRTEVDIENIVAQKKSSPCQLLFFGVEWQRKGGDLAVQLVEALNKKGIAAELTVLGCTPPVPVPDFVKVIGYVSKKTQEGRDLIDGFLHNAHFLIFPSRAECLGLVGAEANSFGVPALTSDVGGFSTLISVGRNGFIYPLECYVEKASETIARYQNDPVAYREIAKTSFEEFQNRLNWDVAGKQVYLILEEAVPKEKIGGVT